MKKEAIVNSQLFLKHELFIYLNVFILLHLFIYYLTVVWWQFSSL